jgi:hypothetical protein
LRSVKLCSMDALARQVLVEPFQKGAISLPGRLLGTAWNSVPPAAVAAPCVGTARCSSPQGADVASSLEDMTSSISYGAVMSPEDVAVARERFPGSLLLGVITPGSTAAWTPEGDALLDACRRFFDAGCDGILFGRGNAERERSSLLSHLDLAERVRLEIGGIVAVEGEPEYLDDLVAGVVANRTDLVVLSGAQNALSLVEGGDLEDL